MSTKEINAATALYAFAGWLTSMKEPITFSEKHWATPAAEMVGAFINLNNLGGDIDFDSIKTPKDSVIPKAQLEAVASERLANLNEDNLISHADMVAKFEIPDPLVDENSESSRIGNIGNILHNMSCSMTDENEQSEFGGYASFCWELGVKLKQRISAVKAEPPTFTQSQADAGELPTIGAECLIMYCSSNYRGVITYMGNGVGCYHSKDNDREYTFALNSVTFKPIQTAEDKLRNKFIHFYQKGINDELCIDDAADELLSEFTITLKG